MTWQVIILVLMALVAFGGAYYCHRQIQRAHEREIAAKVARALTGQPEPSDLVKELMAQLSRVEAEMRSVRVAHKVLQKALRK